MTETDIKDHLDRIDVMDQMEMARLKRFAPVGHPYFDKRLPLNAYFEARFAKLGGMTPRISKAIDL